MLDYSYPPCTPTYYSLFLNDLSKSTTRLLLKSSFFSFCSFPSQQIQTLQNLLFLVAVICKPAGDNTNMPSAAPVTWSSQKHLGKRPWIFLFCFCYILSVSSYLLLVPTISWVFKNKKFQFSLMIHKPVKRLSPVRLEIWLKSWNMTIVP